MLSVEEQAAAVVDMKNGDKNSFDIFYHQYHQIVFRNISKLIHQHEIAEDILQEVFLAFWQHRNELDPEKSVVGWLFVVSYNKSVSWLKKNAKERVRLPEPSAFFYDDEESKLREESYKRQVSILNEAVEKLPLRKKMAFQLCKMEGRSYEEAAEALGISSDTVREYVKTSSKMISGYVASQPISPSMLAVCGLLYVIIP